MSRYRNEFITADQLRIGDVIRRATGELVTVDRVCDNPVGILVTIRTGRGTPSVWAYAPRTPVLVVTR